MNAAQTGGARPTFLPGERFKAVVVESGERNLAQLSDGTTIMVGHEPVDFHALKWGVIDLATHDGTYDEALYTGVCYTGAEVARQITCTDPAGAVENIAATGLPVENLIVGPVGGGQPIVLAQLESPLALTVVVGADGTLSWE